MRKRAARSERRNAFRASLWVEPMWRRLGLAGLVVAVYVAAFVPLYREGDTAVLALSMFPVVILAWLFGAWGGLVAGVASVPVNALLLTVVGEQGWYLIVRESGAEGSALVIVVGCVVGLLRDLGLRLDRHLTDWRTAERALRETEDRYRVLFERSRDPMYVSTAGGRVVEANDALVRLFGYSRAELLDLEVSQLYAEPGDRDRFRRKIDRDGWVEDFPVQVRTRAGEVRDCLMTATARRDASGLIVQYQGSVRDVTTDWALHQLAERRTRELQAAAAELEAFTYSVSHGLRTHLVTLGGFASILGTDHREEMGEKAREYVDRILAASQRMEAFIQDILSYGRVGGAPVRLERVDLADTVKAVRGSLAGQIAERRGSVEVEGDLLPVEADRTLMERVVENLMANALKFVPDGKVPEVRIGSRRQERRVRFEIRDNGIGIASEDVPRAFRAFERLDPGRFPGTGVGLAIVQKAVERMGGEVGVQSEPGGGSTFYVLLRGAPS